eukprot:Phypoly_transcript_17493.p1 GENE.Phypoly_transcript_17493~~Phypoly_transcript_17493.p1  ORF type:complete len:194 (+),score=27.63 Phypoly_transcript_17493:156-737(+)
MFHKKNKNTNSRTNAAAGTLGAQGQPGAGVNPARTVENPAVVEEHVRYDTITEVQPVIHRQVDQVHVHHIEKHIMHESAPSMGGVVERPPIIQDHINHRYVTEVHPVHHAPSYQTEVGSQMMSGPLQSVQQTAFVPQQQAYGLQQAPVGGAYIPNQVPANGGLAPQSAGVGKTGRKHHIFHRPTVRDADGRIV